MLLAYGPVNIHEKSVKIGQDQGHGQCLWAVFVVLTLVCLAFLMSAQNLTYAHVKLNSLCEW